MCGVHHTQTCNIPYREYNDTGAVDASRVSTVTTHVPTYLHGAHPVHAQCCTVYSTLLVMNHTCRPRVLTAHLCVILWNPTESLTLFSKYSESSPSQKYKFSLYELRVYEVVSSSYCFGSLQAHISEERYCWVSFTIVCFTILTSLFQHLETNRICSHQ